MKCPLCLCRFINFPVFETLDQHVRLNINQLNLCCPIKNKIWNPLLDVYSGNLSYDIVQTFQVLYINGRIDINSCV